MLFLFTPSYSFACHDANKQWWNNAAFTVRLATSSPPITFNSKPICQAESSTRSTKCRFRGLWWMCTLGNRQTCRFLSSLGGSLFSIYLFTLNHQNLDQRPLGRRQEFTLDTFPVHQKCLLCPTPTLSAWASDPWTLPVEILPVSVSWQILFLLFCFVFLFLKFLFHSNSAHGNSYVCLISFGLWAEFKSTSWLLFQHQSSHAASDWSNKANT